MVKNLVIVVHGYMDDGEDMWHPWLREKCTTENTLILTPTFPDSYHPKFDEWYKAFFDILGQYEYENLYIIGHSLGGFFTLKILENQIDKLRGVLLISAITQNDAKFTLEFMKDNIKWENIKNYDYKIKLLYSTDDHTVKKEHINRIIDHFKSNTKFEYIETTGHDHYCGKEHTEISDLLIKLLDEN